jgi:ESCRT-I complex subunit VPS37
MYNTQQNSDYRHIIKSENYNEEQLKELTEPTSEYAFGQISKLVNMHPRIKELEETKTKLISENRVQAEKNLSRKDEYENIKNEISQLRNQHSEKSEKYKQLKTQLESSESSLTLESAKDNLRIAQQQAEELAEDRANDFLNEDIELSQFIKEFIKEKVVAHERKLKLDELQAKINDFSVQQTSSGVQNMQATGYQTNQYGRPLPNRPAPGIPQNSMNPSNVPPYPSSSFGAYPAMR